VIDASSGTGLTAFRIAVPEADLDDLRIRLARTRWPDELPDTGWAFGAPLAYVQELAGYWATSYDWRVHEARLNAYPQYLTEIDGQRVHFIHAPSPVADALPLVLTHGWPGSVAEFLDVIDPLRDPGAHGGDPADSFHVVIPSIPGFGFSGPTRERGWDPARIGAAWGELMQRIGYPRYGAHGTDWGTRISRALAVRHPDRLAGLHLTTLSTAAARGPADADEFPDLDTDERAKFAESARRTAAFSDQEFGYGAIQSTRPQTLAYSLTDSPTGQLAWLVEKFRAWTDSEDYPEEVIDRDHMLTNVMIYWLTGTANSSARLYYETLFAPGEPGSAMPWARSEEPCTVPTGFAVFPRDTFLPLRRLAERTNNIVRWTEFEHGGHFSAMEQPGCLVEDLREFFRPLRCPGAASTRPAS